MGVSIHYRFVREEAPEPILKKIEAIAIKLGCIIEKRGYNKLIINPHKDSEWITLHFHKYKTVKAREGWDYEKETLERDVGEISDDEWVCSSFTKTHYAGPETHIKVCEILRMMAAYCATAQVHDEADYYEKGMTKKTMENLKVYWDDYNKFIGNIAGQLKDAFGTKNVISGSDL
jgi:hypothetical protein